MLAYSPCFIKLETTDKLLSTTGYRTVYSVLKYCILGSVVTIDLAKICTI